MVIIKAVELGMVVKLFFIVLVKCFYLVCVQGGINGVVNIKGEGDFLFEYFDDMVYGGDFLVNQFFVKVMCEAVLFIIYLLDCMGVMFNRMLEGFLDFCCFGGIQYYRIVYVGVMMGQQFFYVLDEQVCRYEVVGFVIKYEGWEFFGVVFDDECMCCGIVV